MVLAAAVSSMPASPQGPSASGPTRGPTGGGGPDGGRQPRQAVVTVAIADMHSAPDASSDMVSQATLGQTVDVLEDNASFARVRTPDRYQGWLARAALVEYAAPATPRYAARDPVVEITSLMANVYATPDVTTARPALQAPFATRLELARGAEGRWLEVRLPSGETGHLQAGDARPVAAGARPRRDGEAVVETARRFLGVAYLWGGVTAHGIDCSGLTSRVYAANGVDLPRDADLQFAAGGMLPVERGALRAGDLVFFGRDADHVSHVGIWAGDGRFISATTHQAPVVREDALSDPYWTAIYQGARRPR